jgi:hypothetical protein
MDCIDLDQDRDQSKDIVNMVINLQVPWKADNFIAEWLPAPRYRLRLLHGFSYK